MESGGADASKSSTKGEQVATHAIDGRKDQTKGQPLACTVNDDKIIPDDWWLVELESAIRITRVTIYTNWPTNACKNFSLTFLGQVTGF